MRSLLLVLFSSLLCFGQSTKISPDCDIPFTFTGAGTSQITGCAQNLQGVEFWHMTYQSVGFSGLTITVQEAADAGGTPGIWSTFTAATGSNPQTSLTGLGADSTYTGHAPWVSVNLSGLTGSGTVTGHLYGCRTPGCGGGGPGGGGSSGCVGTTGTPCVVNLYQLASENLGDPSNYGTSPGAVAVIGVNGFITNTVGTNALQLDGTNLGAPSNYGTSPGAVEVPGVNAYITNTVAVNHTQLASTNLGSPSNYGTSPGAVEVPGVNAYITNTPAVTISGAVVDACAASAKATALISLTASGRIITGTSSKKTYICSFDLITATAQNIALVEGTGSTCGTSTAGMAGGTTANTGWNFSANGGLVKGSGVATVFQAAVNDDDVCLLLSGSGQTSGSAQYVVQ